MSRPPEGAAFAAALACLPGMGPATLVSLLRDAAPEECWARVRAGDLPRRGAARSGTSAPPDERCIAMARAAQRMDPQVWWDRIDAGSFSVTWFGRADFPRALARDHQPPGVIFCRGDLASLEAPCVAIVGTRRATSEGVRVARDMGRDLAAEGLCVVSGLALGIDGAAHVGAVAACRAGTAGGPAAVAASGVDVVYPARHRGLWEDVCELGVLISENGPGRRPEAWRFPSRNRLIAALSRLVVVVESHARGGSLITAEAAIDRGIEVRVVPGPVRSSASAGSNQLLYDGPGPVRDARDVLDALGFFRVAPSATPSSESRARPPNQGCTDDVYVADLEVELSDVLSAVPWVAEPLGAILLRCSQPTQSVLAALGRLADRGLVEEGGGYWSRRSGGGQPRLG